MAGKKKMLIIMAALAVLSYGASFLVSRGLGRKAQPGRDKASAASLLPGEVPATATNTETPPPPMQMELDKLIKEVRQKIRQFQQREQQIQEREKRVQVVMGMLEKRSQEMEDLRMQLVAPLTSVAEAIDRLEKTRIRIAREDQTNLKKTAVIYEKMDPTKGSAILTGMCKQQYEDEVVRILYYMQARSAAKILAGFKDESLAARLCEKLKRITEAG